jgi:hypothetical protein
VIDQLQSQRQVGFGITGSIIQDFTHQSMARIHKNMMKTMGELYSHKGLFGAK